MATPSMVVLPAPAAPSTITSGSRRGDRSGGDGLPGIQPRLVCGIGHVGALRLSCRGRGGELVAQRGLRGDHAHDWSGARHAPASPLLAAAPRSSPQVARRVARSMNSRSSTGVACTPVSVVMRVTCSCTVCVVHVEAPAAQRSSARLATSCTAQVFQPIPASASPWAAATAVGVVAGVAEFLPPPLLVLQIGGLLAGPLVRPRDALHPRGHDGAGFLAGMLRFPLGFAGVSRLRLICADRLRHHRR
jgi:hypothetical protein